MEKVLFQNCSDEERIKNLEANADSIEEVGYMRDFTAEELEGFKEELAESSITINDIEEEKKIIMDDFKKKKEPHVSTIKTNLKRIKEKSEFVKEECFKFINHVDNAVGYYNRQGELVYSRPIRGEERQGKIFPLRTGTAN
jgi:hypothetical protein